MKNCGGGNECLICYMSDAVSGIDGCTIGNEMDGFRLLSRKDLMSLRDGGITRQSPFRALTAEEESFIDSILQEGYLRTKIVRQSQKLYPK